VATTPIGTPYITFAVSIKEILRSSQRFHAILQVCLFVYGISKPIRGVWSKVSQPLFIKHGKVAIQWWRYCRRCIHEARTVYLLAMKEMKRRGIGFTCCKRGEWCPRIAYDFFLHVACHCMQLVRHDYPTFPGQLRLNMANHTCI